MRAISKRWVYGGGLALVLGLVVAGGAGCASSEQPAFREPYAATYDYYYYPDMNIYYDPAGGLYYWNRNGSWQSGRSVPAPYVTEGARRERYQFHTREPWTERPMPGTTPTR